MRNLADITFENPTVSEDGLTYSHLFTNDVAQLIADINSDTYRASSPEKSEIIVTGTDQGGATKSYSINSWTGCFPIVARPNEASLSDSLWGHFKGRLPGSTGVCRVTDVRIERRYKKKGISVFIR